MDNSCFYYVNGGLNPYSYINYKNFKYNIIISDFEFDKNNMSNYNNHENNNINYQNVN